MISRQEKFVARKIILGKFWLQNIVNFHSWLSDTARTQNAADNYDFEEADFHLIALLV